MNSKRSHNRMYVLVESFAVRNRVSVSQYQCAEAKRGNMSGICRKEALQQPDFVNTDGEWLL